MKAFTLCTLLFSSALLLSHFALAEEMKFSYQLPNSQNICFLQNIAENIQGKYRDYLHKGFEYTYDASFLQGINERVFSYDLYSHR